MITSLVIIKISKLYHFKININSASSSPYIAPDFDFGGFSKIIHKSSNIIIYFIHLIYFLYFIKKIYNMICIYIVRFYLFFIN